MTKYFFVFFILVFSHLGFSQGFTPSEFPTKWDWRNVNGQNWLTPIRSQQGCGACVAFGLVSTLETQLKIDSNFSWWNPVISVQAIFGCGGGNCGSGWDMNSAINFIKANGLVDENCSPYLDTSGPKSCVLCEDEKSRRYFIQGVQQVTSGVADMAAIKAAIMKGPVWSVMTLYSDFLMYGGWGVYKHNSGTVAGSHTIEIIGWDDSKKGWLVKNSWGEKWGEHGYAYIHYEDTSGLGQLSYTFSFAKNGNYLALQNIKDGDVVDKETSIRVVSENTSIDHIELWIEAADHSAKKMLKSADANNLDVVLNPNDLAADKNNLWAVGTTPTTTIESWRVEILKTPKKP